jgi:hypothetical protein
MRQQAPSFRVRSSLFGLAVPRAGKPRGLSPTHTITSVLSVATIAHEFVCTYTTRFLLIRVEILIYGLIHFTSFHAVRGSRSSL